MWSLPATLTRQDALKDVLASVRSSIAPAADPPQHNATTDTPLVDPEGYPRGDIDVVRGCCRAELT